MSESAEVVIVGGGVIGASVAYHLARGGCTDVLVLDAAPRPGEGSTGRATGGFRAQFGSAPNIRLSLLSRDALRRFAGDTGVDPGYQPVGYLFIARHAAELEVLLQAQALQHAEGLHEARRVDADEARLVQVFLHLMLNAVQAMSEADAAHECSLRYGYVLLEHCEGEPE